MDFEKEIEERKLIDGQRELERILKNSNRTVRRSPRVAKLIEEIKLSAESMEIKEDNK